MGQKRSKGNTNRKSSKSGTDPKNLEIGLESIKPGGVISVLVVASAWPKVTWQFRPAHTWCTRSIYIYIFTRKIHAPINGTRMPSIYEPCHDSARFSSRKYTYIPHASFLSLFPSTLAFPPRLSLTFIALSNSGRPGTGVVLARITCRSYV